MPVHEFEHYPASRTPLPARGRYIIDWPSHFGRLEVGASFVTTHGTRTVRNAARHWAMKHDDSQTIRFSIYKEGARTRCTRVA